MIKYIVILLSVLALQAHATTTILAQKCINVKVPSGTGGFVAWTGTAAVGDGVTDDTAAFQAAIGSVGANTQQTAIYVPSGTYLLSAKFQFAQGHFFGEPSSPPTLVLKSSSGISGPFFLFSNPVNSTNNSFGFFVHDINFTIDSSNSGCTDAVQWDVAQDSSFRNSTITRADGGNCFHETDNTSSSGDNGGGGGAGSVSNITCTNTGAGNALVVDDTSQVPYRQCTFNGPVQWKGYWVASFINCTFNNPGANGFAGSGGDYVELINCTFTSTTTFSCTTNYHLENTLGYTQYSSQNVYRNGTSESGTSSNLNALVPASFPNRSLPEPDSTCIDVTANGVSPNTGTDQGPTINTLLATHNNLFFPGAAGINVYTINTTINLGPGQSIWGDSSGENGFGTTLSGSANPVINVTGAGTGNGVNIVRMLIQPSGTGTGVKWNGDPASNLFDADIQPGYSTTSTPVFLVQTGGFFMDQAWPGAFTATADTWMQYNAQGPTYIVGVNPEHYNGDTMIINDASRLQIRSWEVEYTGSEPAIPITDSGDITLSGALQGGNIPTTFISVDTHSTVSILGMDTGVDASGSGSAVTYNSSGFGAIPVMLQGFLTNQGAPSIPGTLTTIKFQTPATPGTLSTTKQ